VGGVVGGAVVVGEVGVGVRARVAVTVVETDMV
jgi:hypothetical protein